MKELLVALKAYKDSGNVLSVIIGNEEKTVKVVNIGSDNSVLLQEANNPKIYYHMNYTAVVIKAEEG